MSKNLYCTICKHYGKYHEDTSTLEKASLYDERGEPIPIMLCKKHGHDLFKMGQRLFLMSHHRILNDILETDDIKFVDMLEKVVRQNYNEIF